MPASGCLTCLAHTFLSCINTADVNAMNSKTNVAEFPPSLWSVVSWGNKTEAINTGECLGSDLLCSSASPNIFAFMLTRLAWSRLQNLSFLCCPWMSLLSRSAWIAGLARGNPMSWSQPTVSPLLPDYTCHHTGWWGSFWVALEGQYSSITFGGQGRGCSKWLLRVLQLPCSLAGTALRKVQGQSEKGRGHLHSCTWQPHRHLWADTGSPFPQGRAGWEPKPVPWWPIQTELPKGENIHRRGCPEQIHSVFFLFSTESAEYVNTSQLRSI